MSEPSMSITPKESVKVAESESFERIPDKLTLVQAFSILSQAVTSGQQRGIFSIKDSALIYKSLETVVDNKEYIEKCN